MVEIPEVVAMVVEFVVGTDETNVAVAVFLLSSLPPPPPWSLVVVAPGDTVDPVRVGYGPTERFPVWPSISV